MASRSCLPNMFVIFPYSGPKAPAASMYALVRSRAEQIPAHDASMTQHTCPPSYSCFHLRARPRLSGVQSQRSSMMTTVQNLPDGNTTTHLVKSSQECGTHQAKEHDIQSVRGQDMLFVVFPRCTRSCLSDRRAVLCRRSHVRAT